MSEQAIKSNKIQLSLAAVLFFSLLVRKLLQDNTMELDQEAKKFVQSYIIYGYGILLTTLLTVAGIIGYYFIPLQLLYRLHTIGAIAIILAILVGIGAIFSDNQLIQYSNKTAKAITFENIDTKNMLMAYIPGYNIYLRYKLHNFDKPYRRAKESIIVRTLFVSITILLQNPIISVVIIIAIMARIIMLLGSMNILHGDLQKKINSRFYKNPEELRGYVTGFITSLHRYIKHNIRETQETATQHKTRYQKLLSIQTPQIQIELLILLILLLVRVGSNANNTDSRMHYTVATFIIARYAILGRKRKHLPRIPVIHEIIEGIKIILNSYAPNRKEYTKRLSQKK